MGSNNGYRSSQQIDNEEHVPDKSAKKITGDPETVDADGNPVWRVIVTQTPPAEQPGPIDITLSEDTVEEGLPAGTLVGTLTVISGTPPITLTIIDDPGNAFQIIANELQTSRSLDFNIEPTLNVGIRATDVNGKFYDENFVINVEEAGGFQNLESYQFSGNGYIFVNNSAYTGDVNTDWWAWIKPDGKPGSDEFIFNSRNGTSDSGVSLELLSTAPVDVRLHATRNNGNDKIFRYTPADLGVDLFDGRWHLIGYKINNNFVELWVDGQPKVPSLVDLNQNTANLDPDGTAYIGSNEDGTGGYYNGLIDEIGYSVFNLTPTEWALIYNLGVAPDLDAVLTTSQFRNWYRADGDTFPTVTDNKGGIDATIVNVTKSSDTPRAFQNLLATEFDGATNYYLGNATYDFTQPKTWSFWMRRDASGNELIFTIGAAISTDASWRIYGDNNGNNRIYWEFEGSPGTQAQRAYWQLGAATFGQAVHISLTCSANLGGLNINNFDLYLNGVLVTRVNQENDLLAIPATSSSLAFGAGITGGNDFMGVLDQFQVFDYNINATEAQEIYNLGVAKDPRTLSFGSSLYQSWDMGDTNVGSIMTDTENGDVVAMINYDPSFYVAALA